MDFTDWSDRDFEDWILHRMSRKRNWAHNYIARRDAIKCVPSHLLGRADAALNELIRIGLIATYKKGACVYLVPERKQEIRARTVPFVKRMRLDPW